MGRPSTPPEPFEIKAASGNIARVRFKIEGESIAAGILWQHNPTQADIEFASAAAMEKIYPYLAPTADINIVNAGHGSEQQQDELMRRFLRSGQN